MKMQGKWHGEPLYVALTGDGGYEGLALIVCDDVRKLGETGWAEQSVCTDEATRVGGEEEDRQQHTVHQRPHVCARCGLVGGSEGEGGGPPPPCASCGFRSWRT